MDVGGFSFGLIVIFDNCVKIDDEKSTTRTKRFWGRV